MKPNSLFPLLLLGSPLFAADETVRFELSPFSVVGRGDEQTLVEVPAPEIRLQRPADLAEMLANASASVQLVRKGGASNDLRLNGLGEEDLTILQDGQRIYCACPNRMDPPASHTETTAIERIEVVSGAFDLSHAGALGGTVAVFTRDPGEEFRAEVDLSVGSFGFQRTGATLEGTAGDFSALFSASYATSDPYEDGDGRSLTGMPDTSPWPLDDYLPDERGHIAYREGRLSTKVVWQPSPNQHHRLHFGYRRGTDILYPALRMDADLNESSSFALENEWDTDGALIDSLSLKTYYNTTQHDMSDRLRRSSRFGMGMSDRPQYVLERGYYMESLAETSTTGAHLQVEKTTGPVHWQGGLEAILRDWNIDNRLGAGMAMAGPAMEIFNNMIPDTRSLVLGAFLENDWAVNEHWTVSSGLRFDRYATEARAATPTLDTVRGSRGGSEEDVVASGKLLLRYRFHENRFLYGGIGHTSRPPNGRERYLNLQRPGMMPNWVGNPELDPPSLTEYTAGAGWNVASWSFHARFFAREITDYIYPERSMSGSKPIQSFTGIDARVRGAELTASGFLNEQWSSHFAASWQSGRKRSHPEGNTDADLAEIPGGTLRGELRYHGESWFGSVEVRHFLPQTEVDEVLGEQALESSTVVDFRLGWELPVGGTLYVGVENLFDRTYRLHNAYVRNPFGSDAILTEPGRTIYGRWLFEF